MHKIIFTLHFFVFTLLTLTAQIPPVADPAWILQSGSSEEFNATLDFTNKWYPQLSYGNINPNGCEILYQTNLIQTGSTLKIKADTLIPGVLISPSNWNTTPSNGVTYRHQGGCIQSRNVSGASVYKYGYIEISAKYPSSGCFPLWPAFWLWSADCSIGGFYDEIDIAEMAAFPSFNGNRIGNGILRGYNSGNVDVWVPLDPITVANSLSTSFNKFAVEWSPDRLTWYFNDSPIRTFFDSDGDSIPQHAMDALLNFSLDPYWAFVESDWTNWGGSHAGTLPTCFPQYFEIDYLRSYYKLNVTGCASSLHICTPSTDYSSRGVQKDISTGGSCTTTFNTSDSYTLRGTDFVLLDAGTTINPNSSGFFAILTLECPQ